MTLKPKTHKQPLVTRPSALNITGKCGKKYYHVHYGVRLCGELNPGSYVPRTLQHEHSASNRKIPACSRRSTAGIYLAGRYFKTNRRRRTRGKKGKDLNDEGKAWTEKEGEEEKSLNSKRKNKMKLKDERKKYLT
jgi:hypothetical protein